MTKIKLTKREQKQITEKSLELYNKEISSTKKARAKNKITKAFNYAIDDEGYTTKEDIQFFIDMAKIPKSKVIGCPFDLETSNFVTVFKKNGYKVINSHILTGGDFYKGQPKQHGDIIVSNPPFRGKHKLLERLLKFNKPGALIFGIQCLNSEKFCDMLQQFKRPQYVHLKRRMCFTKDHLHYDVKHLQRPSFASMGVCNDLFKKIFKFEKVLIIRKMEGNIVNGNSYNQKFNESIN